MLPGLEHISTGGGLGGTASRPSTLARMLGLMRRDTNIVIATVIFNNALRVIRSMILTRLLAPEIFGITGIIGTITFTLYMISDLGFQAFVVRHQDGGEARFRDTIWTIRLIRGAMLTLAMLILSGPIAQALGKPAIAVPIAVASLGFLLESLGSLTLITALRDRQLAQLSLMEVAAAVAELLIAILLVLLFPNLWAVIAAMLLGSAIKSGLSYVFFPAARRRLHLDMRYAGELWHFARYITASSVISLVLIQGDKIVFARLLDLHTLGLYALAGNLAIAPLAFTTAYASRVLYPDYARIWRENPSMLRAASYARRRTVSLLYCFDAGGLIGGAPVLIAILYDHRYAGAVPYLQILAISPLLALGSMAANEALTASGRVQVTFHANVAKLVWLCVTGPCAYLGFGAWGLVWVAGTLELPTLLYSWLQLARAKLLDIREEIFILSGAVAGFLVGEAMAMILMPVLTY